MELRSGTMTSEGQRSFFGTGNLQRTPVSNGYNASVSLNNTPTITNASPIFFADFIMTTSSTESTLVEGIEITGRANIPQPDEAPDEPPESQRFSRSSSFMKPFIVLALPGIYLFYKYNQYRREQRDVSRRLVTENELQYLHHKINSLLNKLEETEPETATSQEDECVICVNAKATMQTSPCGHRVVCRCCFVKTIQMAISQRILPLRCIICRAKILRLRQTHGQRRISKFSKSSGCMLPQSVSNYNVSASVSFGVSRSDRRWVTSRSVSKSASLYSMSSGASSVSSGASLISGVSSVSSTTSSEFENSKKSLSMTVEKTESKKLDTLYPREHRKKKMSVKIQDLEGSKLLLYNDYETRHNYLRLPTIEEFQKDHQFGSYPKISTKIKCAQKIIKQLESSSSSGTGISFSKSTASSQIFSEGNSLTRFGDNAGSSMSSKSSFTGKTQSGISPKKLTVCQEVQKMKKEKERQRVIMKSEKERLKKEIKAEKARLKETKIQAMKEKKSPKKRQNYRKIWLGGLVLINKLKIGR